MSSPVYDWSSPVDIQSSPVYVRSSPVYVQLSPVYVQSSHVYVQSSPVNYIDFAPIMDWVEVKQIVIKTLTFMPLIHHVHISVGMSTYLYYRMMGHRSITHVSKE